MIMARSWVNCPKCKNEIHRSGSRSPRYYGDPHVVFPKCNTAFLDPWIIELAFFPRDWYAKHHRRISVLLLLYAIPVLFIGLVASSSIFQDFVNNSDGAVVGSVFVGTLIIWAISVAIYYNNTTNISIKEACFEDCYQKSEKRLYDPIYKQALQESKYYKAMCAHIKDNTYSPYENN